ncbi:hypothetical protein FRACA_600011 [Frankia canadensis]|uniref:Uncharacterized protein n=1 Tax=Frankia canadensis TaxID=1836972 RepID=A0A2I2KZM1_9ACTN|nr:hypothetical protein [Frankia canadensis]SNQ51100.1 hypothetical protein FRACA_600011 [Frankia canadensis]SOU58390.1 hypothetical protein FRACA_600011 [Frankia canadensis]
MAHSVEVRVPFVGLFLLTAATATAHRHPVGKAAFVAAIAGPVLTKSPAGPSRLVGVGRGAVGPAD